MSPEDEAVSGFVFKIQANMDPKHRDRIAFVRLCSGHFRRGMKLKHVRTGKMLTLHNPMLFLAQDRELAEEAWAGDIIGIPNHGNLRIGDTLTEGEDLFFTGIPSFAPEMLQKARPTDPMRAKHLGRALQQLAEEGAARVFKPRLDADWIVGVVGPLQFEVLADRIRTEYDVPVRFEATQILRRPLDRSRRQRVAEEVPRRKRVRAWPRITPARPSSSRATPGISTRRWKIGRGSNSLKRRNIPFNRANSGAHPAHVINLP